MAWGFEPPSPSRWANRVASPRRSGLFQSLGHDEVVRGVGPDLEAAAYESVGGDNVSLVSGNSVTSSPITSSLTTLVSRPRGEFGDLDGSAALKQPAVLGSNEKFNRPSRSKSNP